MVKFAHRIGFRIPEKSQKLLDVLSILEFPASQRVAAWKSLYIRIPRGSNFGWVRRIEASLVMDEL